MHASCVDSSFVGVDKHFCRWLEDGGHASWSFVGEKAYSLEKKAIKLGVRRKGYGAYWALLVWALYLASRPGSWVEHPG